MKQNIVVIEKTVYWRAEVAVPMGSEDPSADAIAIARGGEAVFVTDPAHDEWAVVGEHVIEVPNDPWECYLGKPILVGVPGGVYAGILRALNDEKLVLVMRTTLPHSIRRSAVTSVREIKNPEAYRLERLLGSV